MNTNYYVQDKDGRELHVGKDVPGWQFLFYGDHARGLESFAAWRVLLAGLQGDVYTEDGAKIERTAFYALIEAARHWRSNPSAMLDDEGYNFTYQDFL